MISVRSSQIDDKKDPYLVNTVMKPVCGVWKGKKYLKNSFVIDFFLNVFRRKI